MPNNLILPPQNPSDFGFFGKYIGISKKKYLSLIEGLNLQLLTIQALYQNLSKEQENFAYATDKWTLKQNLVHIIDTERIFAYRALRFGRADSTPLPGFEQDNYMDNAPVLDVAMADILIEFILVRQSTIALFQNLNPALLDFEGTGSNQTLTARAMGFAILGHAQHHLNIINERYLPFFK